MDLGGGRVLWLFGDTFVATSAAGVRSESTMVRNSVAVQTGYDPSRASIAFRWGASGASPAPFFPGAGASWYWPGSGATIGGRLIVFLSSLVPAPAASPGLGFRADGWTAVAIDNPAEDPSSWKPVPLRTPVTPGVTFGASAIVRDGERAAEARDGPSRLEAFLYVFGAEDESHAVHLVRWPAAAVADGDLSAPEWWTPSGWVPHARRERTPTTTSVPHAAAPVFADGSTELSVQPDPHGGGWIEVQAIGFGAATLSLRSAPDLVGPWGPLQALYRPPESARPDVLVYAGKGHPELAGADLVVTYATNSTSFAALVADTSLYYPRFVRVTRLSR
jgi:hypothetical protein